MPFGLTNRPSIFLELISVDLNGLEKYAAAYIDDILIFSATKKDHLRHVQNLSQI